MLGRTRRVPLDELRVEVRERLDRLIGRRKAEERAVSRRVDDATGRRGQLLLQHVDVPLLERAARAVAEASEVVGRTDDVAEGEREAALEFASDLLREMLPETDHLRQRQPGEVERHLRMQTSKPHACEKAQRGPPVPGRFSF